jgi:hypothetical protein
MYIKLTDISHLHEASKEAKFKKKVLEKVKYDTIQTFEYEKVTNSFIPKGKNKKDVYILGSDVPLIQSIILKIKKKSNLNL